jgi:creatinine amidohydrolase
VELASRAWPELDPDARPVLVLPLGATEQHGPHLPLDTDTVIAAAACEAAAAGRPDVVAAPVLPYGSSGEHAGFPGTLSLGQEALERVVIELVRSAAAHFGAVVLASWHGGNAEPLRRATALLRGEGHVVGRWEPSIRGGDAHAGRVETSLMLAIAPGRVRAERPVGASEPLADLLPVLRERGVGAVSPTGVLGDARGASAEEGRALLRRLTADLLACVEATRGAA